MELQYHDIVVLQNFGMPYTGNIWCRKIMVNHMHTGKSYW